VSENERLRKELEALVYALDFEDLSDSVDLNGAKSALAAEPETCVWRHNDYGYHTGCPQDVWLSSELLHIIGCYIEDGLNAIVYCPGCGREIEVKGE